MGSAAAIAAGIVAGYLIGSVPVADLVTRRRRAPDLRTVGDHNPGYWNARETLGRRAAIPVFAGDVAKGAVAALIGRWLGPEWWVAYVTGLAAMVGHAWPVFARFRGGRSVLTMVGVLIVVAPGPAAIAIAACALVSVVTRRFELGARVGVFGFPLIQLVLQGPYRTAASGVLMTFVGLRFLQAHRSDPARSGAGRANR